MPFLFCRGLGRGVIKRHYSELKSSIFSLTLSRDNFFEWFRGFTDAEGCFYITTQNASPSSSTFSFAFTITVHKDDIKVLEIIKQYLQMGNIYLKGNVVTFKISKQKEINTIIEMFTKAPLNSIKQLEFWTFKEAFNLYTGTKTKDIQLKGQIEALKAKMNRSRTDYNWANRKPNITPYWLLGMIEGDGSFYVIFRNNSISLKFDISQSNLDLDLLGAGAAIKNYLNSLAAAKGLIKQDRSYLDVSDFTSISKTNLKITHTLFIGKVLIPFLDDLTFLSRKGLDYKYWVFIFKLRERGIHHIPEGAELIDLIFSQMNERRYSTYKGERRDIDPTVLQAKLDKFLHGPSNYVFKEGKVWVVSLNRFLKNTSATGVEMLDETGAIIDSWRTITECAKSIGLSREGVQKRIKSQKFYSFNDRLGVLKIIETEGD